MRPVRLLVAAVALAAGLLTVALSLGGCGIAAKITARNDMEQSKAAYKACLAQHPQDLSACDGPKAAFEADMEAYRATSAGIRPGRSDTIDIQTHGAGN